MRLSYAGGGGCSWTSRATHEPRSWLGVACTNSLPEAPSTATSTSPATSAAVAESTQAARSARTSPRGRRSVVSPRSPCPTTCAPGCARRACMTRNPTYAELAARYDMVVVPARVRRPGDKAAVAAGVQVA